MTAIRYLPWLDVAHEFAYILLGYVVNCAQYDLENRQSMSTINAYNVSRSRWASIKETPIFAAVGIGQTVVEVRCSHTGKIVHVQRQPPELFCQRSNMLPQSVFSPPAQESYKVWTEQ